MSSTVPTTLLSSTDLLPRCTPQIVAPQVLCSLKVGETVKLEDSRIVSIYYQFSLNQDQAEPSLDNIKPRIIIFQHFPKIGPVCA